MKVALVTALVAALSASPAPSEVILWGKVTAGMSLSRVRELYPNTELGSGILGEHRVFLFNYDIDGCKASVNFMMDKNPKKYPDAKVTEVELNQLPSDRGECPSLMFTQLLARYGEPVTKVESGRRATKRAVWVADGKTITYDEPYGWKITYAPVKDLGL